MPGCIVEIGCANGNTTVFLNKYMDAQGIDKTYQAIDTFSGFVGKDIEFEVSNRQKREDYYDDMFKMNSKKWFDWTMQRNGVTRVRSIQADVNQFDLATLGPLSFVLLDVDLYRPVMKCLTEIYDLLSSGGIAVIDDCDAENPRWDGADQAYKEFMKNIDQPVDIRCRKLGIVRKNKDSRGCETVSPEGGPGRRR